MALLLQAGEGVDAARLWTASVHTSGCEQAKADVNAASPDGSTPLMMSAENGSLPIVKANFRLASRPHLGWASAAPRLHLG